MLYIPFILLFWQVNAWTCAVQFLNVWSSPAPPKVDVWCLELALWVPVQLQKKGPTLELTLTVTCLYSRFKNDKDHLNYMNTPYTHCYWCTNHWSESHCQKNESSYDQNNWHTPVLSDSFLPLAHSLMSQIFWNFSTL